MRFLNADFDYRLCNAGKVKLQLRNISAIQCCDILPGIRNFSVFLWIRTATLYALSQNEVPG
jgi:hypothetical protein